MAVGSSRGGPEAKHQASDVPSHCFQVSNVEGHSAGSRLWCRALLTNLSSPVSLLALIHRTPPSTSQRGGPNDPSDSSTHS